MESVADGLSVIKFELMLVVKIAVPVLDCPLKLTALLVTSPVILNTVGLVNDAADPLALPSKIPVNVPEKFPEKLVPVSYTHLTLPTIYSV